MPARFLRTQEEKDLFGQIQKTDKKQVKKQGFSLPRIKDKVTISYENLIFIVIGCLIFGIISFSLGVEKGRRDIGYLKHKRANIDKREKPSGGLHLRKDSTITMAETNVRDEYLIQLAAYKTKLSAEKERERLRNDGYPADIKRSGIYYQLYIGGFENRDDAERLLNTMRQRFSDCYIKKR